MAQNNPYGGTYRPSSMSISKQDLILGLKGIKLRAPNRKQSTASYKSGLPKENEGGGGG
jgi:hypothetical protein